MLADSPAILITDNDHQFRDTVLEVLRPSGYRTLEADDGLEAMKIVQQEQVHVVLLDMHINGISKYSCSIRVRAAVARCFSHSNGSAGGIFFTLLFAASECFVAVNPCDRTWAIFW